MFQLTTQPRQEYRRIELLLAITCYRLGVVNNSDPILGTTHTVGDIVSACNRSTFDTLIKNIEYIDTGGASGLGNYAQKTLDMYNDIFQVPTDVLRSIVEELLS